MKITPILFKKYNTFDTKRRIYNHYDFQVGQLCHERKIERTENMSLETNFDIYTLNKKTRLILDENKKLKSVHIENSKDEALSLDLEFNDEQLSKMTYNANGKKIKANIKSKDFETAFLLSSNLDLNTGILIGDINSRSFADNHIFYHFEYLNNMIYGKMPKELKKVIKEYEKILEGKKIFVDHNIDPKNVENIIEILQEIPKEEIPDSILLTNFIDSETAGLFCNKSAIVIRPSRHKETIRHNTSHEIQHHKDYFTGEPLGQNGAGKALIFDRGILNDCNGQILDGDIKKKENKIKFKNKELKRLIESKVSKYAATDTAEFIAELGAMMRTQKIGVSLSDRNKILYSIKKSYKNADFDNCTIGKNDFKTLLKVYGLVGGTPEFNNITYYKDAHVLTSEEIFK